MGLFVATAADGERRLRLVFRILLALVGTLAVQILAGLIGGTILLVFFAVKGELNLETFATDVRSPEWMLPLQMLTALPMAGGLVGLFWILRTQLDKRPFVSLGFGRPRRGWLRCIAGGLLLGAIPILTSVVLLWVFQLLEVRGVSAGWVVAVLPPALLVMAFSEEIVCRGYILQNFIDIERPVLGLVVSSGVFWLAHGTNPDVWSSPFATINLLGAGVLLGLAYVVSRNLWFPTLIHFAWNLTQGVVFELPVSGIQTDGIIDVTVLTDSVWGGGGFGLENTPWITALELAMIAGFAIVWYRRGYGRTTQQEES